MTSREITPGRHSPEPLMTPDDLGRYLGRSVGALAQLRYLGTGPRFLRLGRSIRYRRADVDEWIASGERTQT